MKKHRLLCNNNWGNINKPTTGEVPAFENWNRKFTTDICGFLDFETVWLLRTKIVSRIQSWKCWWQKTPKIMIMEWLLHLIMLLGIVTHCWKFWWQEPQRWIWTHSTFLGYLKNHLKNRFISLCNYFLTQCTFCMNAESIYTFFNCDKNCCK